MLWRAPQTGAPDQACSQWRSSCWCCWFLHQIWSWFPLFLLLVELCVPWEQRDFTWANPGFSLNTSPPKAPCWSRILVWSIPCQKSIVSFPKGALYSPGRCPAPSEAVSELGEVNQTLWIFSFIRCRKAAAQFHLSWVKPLQSISLFATAVDHIPSHIVVGSTPASSLFALEEAPQWSSFSCKHCTWAKKLTASGESLLGF